MTSHKTYIRLVIFSVISTFLALLPLAAATLTTRALHDNVEYRKIRVESDAGDVYVHLVLIDKSAIEDGSLIVEPVSGGTNAGSTGSVQSMANRSDAFACINGPYFAESGSKIYPLGFTVLDGRVAGVGNLNRPLVGLDPDGDLKIEVGHPKVFVTSEAYMQPVWIWSINASPEEDVVTLFDRSWGASVSFDGGLGGLGVAVGPIPPIESGENDIRISLHTDRMDDYDGEVVEVSTGGSISIPEDGFALVFRGRSVPEAEKYTPGTGVAIYAYELPDGFESLEWIVTLGPWFIRNGNYSNFTSETSYGGGITGRAVRSAIGITWNDEIFFAKTTGPGLTTRQAADALIECNAREAVMCDSGSSSGMWVEGIGMVGSSRAIPLAFVVRESTESDTGSHEPLRVWEGRLAR